MRLARFIHLHIIKNRATRSLKRKLKKGCNKYSRRIVKFLLNSNDFDDVSFVSPPYYSDLDF